MRLTGQATQKDKLGFYIDQQYVCTGSSLTLGGGGCREPDRLGGARRRELAREHHDLRGQRPAAGRPGDMDAAADEPAAVRRRLFHVYQPLGLDGAARCHHEPDARHEPAHAPARPPTPCGRPDHRSLVPLPNFTYRGLDNFFDNKQSPHNWRANVSYVTGAHNMKFGYQGNYYIEETHGLGERYPADVHVQQRTRSVANDG